MLRVLVKFSMLTLFLYFCPTSAEAYHYFVLAQQQLYDGQVENALKTAMHLMGYEDVMSAVDIYSLIALASYYAKYFAQCSKAFIRLESLDLPPVSLLCLCLHLLPYCIVFIFMIDYRNIDVYHVIILGGDKALW